MKIVSVQGSTKTIAHVSCASDASFQKIFIESPASPKEVLR
jgi:hypothetical protein